MKNLNLILLVMTILLIGVGQIYSQTLCASFGEDEPDTEWANDVTMSEIEDSPGSGTTTITGDHIVISRDIIVDNTTTFDSCIIQFDGPGEILVSSGASLTLKNTKIFRCDNLWQGIRVVSSNLIIDKCEIEDAERAIQSSRYKGMEITGTTFNRNLVGISIDGDLGRQGATPLEDGIYVYISGCTFDCTDTLNDAYEGMSISTPVLSFTGIYSSNAIISVGDIPESMNTFQNMMNGILSIQSHLIVKNTRFFNLELFGGVNNPIDTSEYWDGIAPSSVGIHAKDYSLLFVNGLGKLATSTPSFENMKKGIETINARVEVENCLFFEVLSGVIGQPMDRSVAVMNNRFTDTTIQAGTSAVDLKGPRDGIIKIWDNVIDIETEGAAITGAMLPGRGLFSVKNNTIKVEGRKSRLRRHGSGIKIISTNERRTQIISNTIDITNGWSGINVEGSMSWDLRIDSNVISGVDGRTTHGIRLATSDHAKVCGNEFDSAEVGIMIADLSMSSNLIGNTIGEHDYGLWVDSMSSIRAHFHPGNIWDASSYEDWGAFNQSDAFGNGLFQRYYVDTSSNRKLAPPGVSWQPNDWFAFQSQNRPDTCVKDAAVRITVLDSFIASGDVYDSTDIRAYIHNANKYLIRKLMHDPSLKTGKALFTDYYDNFSDSVVFKLEEVEKKIYDAFIEDEDLQDDISEVEEGLIVESLKFDSLTIAYVASPTTAEELEMETSIEKIDSLFKLLKSNCDSLKEIRDEILAVAESKNNAIVPTDTIETLETEVNEIYIDFLEGDIDTFTSTQFDFLQELGNQCIQYYGDAVLRARWLLGPDFVVDTNATCINPNQQLSKAAELPVLVTDPSESLAKIFPNPANQELMIQFAKPLETRSQIIVYDMLGNRIIDTEIQANYQAELLDIRALHSGSYILVIDTRTGMIETHRFEVVKN